MKTVKLQVGKVTALFDASTRNRIEDVLDDVRIHLNEAEPAMQIVLSVVEMTKEQFETHPEFKGY